MDERAAAGKHLGVEHRRDQDQREHADRKPHRVVADLAAAEAVIDEPAGRERGDRDRNRLPGRERHHAGIDQVRLGMQVVLNDQQAEAGEPGEIGLPLEPVQHVRQRRRRDRVFLDVVEAAAVHLPGGAHDAGVHLLPLQQRVVERHEIERRADPADGDHHVRPADQQIQPFSGKNLQARLLRSVGSGREFRPVTSLHAKIMPGSRARAHDPSHGHSGALAIARSRRVFDALWRANPESRTKAVVGVVALDSGFGPFGPPRNDRGESYGTRMVDPVVLRPSRSWCAFAASLSLYFWLIGILTLPLPTTSNRFLAMSSRSARLAA